MGVVLLNIKQLEYFLEASKQDSLSQAAEKLFISHQALSSAIKSLESELGFSLFNRSLQGISLTAKGTQILEDAEKILAIFYGWQQMKMSEQTSISGDVYVAAPPGICSSIMSDIIIHFAELYPQVNIILYEARDLELFDLITTGRPCIAVDGYSGEMEITLAYAISRKYKLVLEEVYTDSFRIFLNAKNPLADKTYLEEDDLSQLTLATYPNKEYHCAYQEVYNLFNSEKSYLIMHQDSIFNLISVRSEVATIYPKIISENNMYCKQNIIKALPLAGYELPVINFILHRTLNHCTLAERLIIDKIKEGFSKLNL